nr:FxLYD domain-containing protein [uncultured Methanoregula sp.]
MRTVYRILALVIAAVLLSGCMGASPEIVMPKTRLASGDTHGISDCFFRINDSAHSLHTGTVTEITLTGYIGNSCSRPMDNLVVHGTFYDRDGRVIAGTETRAGYLGPDDVAAFSLLIDTPYSGPFTYRIWPEIREEKKLF